MVDTPTTSTPKSTIGPMDRRGLGEVATWVGILGCLTIITLVILILQAIGHQTVEIPNSILGLITGVVTAAVARGTQGAVERSGSSDAYNQAATQMHNMMEAHREETRALLAEHRAALSVAKEVG